MSKLTQPGGASTISGVSYQMLWCLLRVLRIRVRDLQNGVNIPEALLVLEPAGGGGDLRVMGNVTEIEQLKAKSDSGTWSLQTIITSVLPDLFLSVTNQTGNARFRFVTEGKMGNWISVHKFFQRLGNVTPPIDILKALDNFHPLTFATARRKQSGKKAKAFFPNPPYTERALFLHIAHHLQSHAQIVGMKLDESELHRRLWLLLGAFEFLGSQSRETVQREIDNLLLAVVDRREQLPQIRDTLAQALMRKAGMGNVQLTADSLLQEHGLNAVPLTHWASIRTKSHNELDRSLRSCGYSDDFDVRKSVMSSASTAWCDSARPLVISGESGQGKTWSLAAIAKAAGADDAPVLWVDATGDAIRDLEAASNTFWLNIRGGETSLPLRQIVARLDSVVPSCHRQQLRVCFDNIVNYGEAKAILREDWPSVGISVALSCSIAIATSLKAEFNEAVEVLPCDDFTWEELHEFLERRLESEWTNIPADVRETLRRPLLAAIYCDELFDESWNPANEYELFDALWKRLSTREQASSPLDAVLLERLAESVLREEPYPWKMRQLLEMGVDNAALIRLERCGWLVRTGDGHVRIFHDRLLNWAIAQALFSKIQSIKQSPEQIIDQVAALGNWDARIGKMFLGYVPMDFLWLVTSDLKCSEQIGSALLKALEPNYRNQSELLYRKDAVTVGKRVASALFSRYRDFDGFPWVRKAIGEAIAVTAGDQFHQFAKTLLFDTDPRHQRAGLKLIRFRPCPDLLNQIWNIHVRGMTDPAPFLDEGEQSWLFREDSWRALRGSAAQNPKWIVQMIKQADPAHEPVHDLAWLIANLQQGSAEWHESKECLFDKVDSTKTRVLAHCVGIYRDREKLDWLRQMVSARSELCGPVALQAISRIAPNEAVQELDRAELNDLRCTSRTVFSEVWHRRPTESNAQLLTMVASGNNPWQIGFLYHTRPNDIPLPLFEILLQQLAERLSTHLSASTNATESRFYQELGFIAEVTAPECLDSLQAKRGSVLESSLCEYLRRIGPQRGSWYNGHEREPGLTILWRINGDAFTAVVNEYLQCDDRFGRHEAIEWASRRPDSKTFEIANAIVERAELWDGFPIEQSGAMRLLALYERWPDLAKGLIRWGLRTTHDIVEERLVPTNYDAPCVIELRRNVDANPTPENVFALGCCGKSHDIERIQSLLEMTDYASDLALGCIVGLELLGDCSDRGIALVARHLTVAKLEYSASRMLTSAGTPKAWGELCVHLRSQFDHITALNLLNFSEYAYEVAEIVLSQLPEQQSTGQWGMLRILIRNMRPGEVKERILGDRWLRDVLHREAVASEGMGWFVGSKSAAIECLAEFDVDCAFDAARQALRTPDWHDRERYPYILNEINATRSIPILLDCLDEERAGPVRHAIGRVFADHDLEGELRPRFDSRNPTTRAAACFAASWARDGLQMADILRRSLDDANEEVIRAAMDAIDRLRNRAISVALIARANAAADPVQKWIYVDALIDTVDLGDDFRPLPPQLLDVWKQLSPIVRKFALDRIKKRRKKVFDELKKTRDDD